MNLIPVIDLMRGQVVRAHRGARGSYRPIESRLCASSDPITVARVLRDHCDADQLYIADLDALTGGRPQVAILRSLQRALPQTELWVDAGCGDARVANELLEAVDAPAGCLIPVLASESMRSRQAFEQAFGPAGDDGSHARKDWVLSLDRRDGVRLDAAGCWTLPALWPTRVIAMTLEQVGTDAGPDLETFAALSQLNASVRWFGAGGVRDPGDLERARAAGASGWLVASALHDLRLPPMRR
ncbi:MAG TPA: HisA/HisF-related TIM barrel protein [Burkholderiaceae bacterium]|nr:HisA/HisF-related TIM barrel protein [Burkholderiaceae bacterium]